MKAERCLKKPIIKITNIQPISHVNKRHEYFKIRAYCKIMDYTDLIVHIRLIINKLSYTSDAYVIVNNYLSLKEDHVSFNSACVSNIDN